MSTKPSACTLANLVELDRIKDVKEVLGIARPHRADAHQQQVLVAKIGSARLPAQQLAHGRLLVVVGLGIRLLERAPLVHRVGVAENAT
jgi:hypothetical protein